MQIISATYIRSQRALATSCLLFCWVLTRCWTATPCYQIEKGHFPRPCELNHGTISSPLLPSCWLCFQERV
ncbi:hypothetical protein B0J12DRAFT_665615 [Macrophomina phaseolina]|uniref:Secreted protein n=1 Tax=Macrophomina phaseolina TaxID=35725 RepID=A0ABQ8G8Y5_9PEZI|nr:hypothetical protein B0J12DRAFT_665615 [Macrophomina phaseolina]